MLIIHIPTHCSNYFLLSKPEYSHAQYILTTISFLHTTKFLLCPLSPRSLLLLIPSEKKKAPKREQPNMTLRKYNKTRQNTSHQGWTKQPNKGKVFLRAGKRGKVPLASTVRSTTQHQVNSHNTPNYFYILPHVFLMESVYYRSVSATKNNAQNSYLMSAHGLQINAPVPELAAEVSCLFTFILPDFTSSVLFLGKLSLASLGS